MSWAQQRLWIHKKREGISVQGNSRKLKLLEAWVVSKLHQQGQVPAGKGGNKGERGSRRQADSSADRKESENVLEFLQSLCI